MTSSNGNIFRVTGPLCGEFTGHRWIPRTKVSDAELWYFLWSVPWINGWVNNREAGDLRRHRANYDVIVMYANGISQENRHWKKEREAWFLVANSIEYWALVDLFYQGHATTKIFNFIRNVVVMGQMLFLDSLEKNNFQLADGYPICTFSSFCELVGYFFP